MTQLKVKKREKTGKQSKQVRKQGQLLGVLYGREEKPVPVSVDPTEFTNVYKEAGETAVIDLRLGEKTVPVLIYDFQKDPITGEITHVDFYRVRMDEKITTEVPLEFIGESSAVKNEEGVLIKSLQELEVEALPKDMPQKIEVDVSALATFDDVIYTRDLLIPEGVKVLQEADTPVASVMPPRSEKELEELSEEPGEAAAEEEAEEESEEKTEDKDQEPAKEEKEEAKEEPPSDK